MRFKIGDRVRVIKPCPFNRNVMGQIGTVIDFTAFANFGVEFDHFINGHNCNDLGKDNCCWWCDEDALELIDENSPKIVITTDNVTTTARLYNGKTIIKSASVKCSPDDFETGARLAFDKLLYDEPLHIMSDGIDYGEVGKPTKHKDINGEPLFIGDVVEIFDKNLISYGMNFVVNNSGYGDFIMFCSDARHNHGESWTIIKRKSYKDCKVGDEVNFLTVKSRR